MSLFLRAASVLDNYGDVLNHRKSHSRWMTPGEWTNCIYTVAREEDIEAILAKNACFCEIKTFNIFRKLLWCRSSTFRSIWIWVQYDILSLFVAVEWSANWHSQCPVYANRHSPPSSTRLFAKTTFWNHSKTSFCEVPVAESSTILSFLETLFRSSSRPSMASHQSLSMLLNQ